MKIVKHIKYAASCTHARHNFVCMKLQCEIISYDGMFDLTNSNFLNYIKVSFRSPLPWAMATTNFSIDISYQEIGKTANLAPTLLLVLLLFYFFNKLKSNVNWLGFSCSMWSRGLVQWEIFLSKEFIDYSKY